MSRNCDLCGGEIQPVGDWTSGNSAAPFQGRCCDECHNRFAIPARLMHVSDIAALVMVKRFAELGRTYRDCFGGRV